MMLLTIPLLFLLCGEGQGRSLIPHVTAPEKWRLGVLEKVLVQTSQQSESFPVTVSLVSYPDKKTTFSSALLALTPENRFRGALKLSVEAEDSPGEFVYLLVESEVFREDRRIPVTSAARTTMDEPVRGWPTHLATHPPQSSHSRIFFGGCSSHFASVISLQNAKVFQAICSIAWKTD
ncbi:unnamed protein product [Ranitomeya imitator]|uniref:Complement C3/4/5 macroglobulin domain-containing protein n=1 Tax=Ranitomeya imitator TaxID=111125 RepID=A0ABN9M825_9NEOB|nr:unnamed protein product [Ranitomeya imitator]